MTRRGLLEDNARVTICDPQVSLHIGLVGIFVAHLTIDVQLSC